MSAPCGALNRQNTVVAPARGRPSRARRRQPHQHPPEAGAARFGRLYPHPELTPTPVNFAELSRATSPARKPSRTNTDNTAKSCCPQHCPDHNCPRAPGPRRRRDIEGRLANPSQPTVTAPPAQQRRREPVQIQEPQQRPTPVVVDDARPGARRVHSSLTNSDTVAASNHPSQMSNCCSHPRKPRATAR